jgi:hypothetical protein
MQNCRPGKSFIKALAALFTELTKRFSVLLKIFANGNSP